MITAYRLSGVLLAFSALVLLTGCGAGHHSVTGTVKLKGGEVVKNGKVTMMGEKGESFATIQPDGTYTMGTLSTNDGVPPGTYKVGVEAFSEATDSDPYGKSLIDSKYNNPDTSGLTLTVDGDKEFDIELEPGK